MRIAWMAIALTLATGTARALDLAGYTLGQQFTQADRDALVRNGAGGGGCDNAACHGMVYLGDVTGQATVTLDGAGRISSVSVEFASTDFAVIARAAKEKFGKPSIVRSGSAQNGFGATFQDARLAWHRRDGKVTLTQRFGSIDTSAISVSAPGFKREAPKVKL